MSNPRPRRSRSVGGVTIDHRPAQQPVPLNTVMQPNIPKRRSVTKLTEKDIMDKKVSNYCLTTQGQDTDGEVETKVYQVRPFCQAFFFGTKPLLSKCSPFL